MRLHETLLTLSVTLIAFAGVQAEDAKSDQQKLQGVWDVTEFIVDGHSVVKGDLKFKITFAEDTLTLQGPGGVGGRRVYKFTLDATTVPTNIDTIPQDGPFKGKTGPAIYELSGDTLKLCLPNQLTKKRPKEFKSVKGSDLGLMVLKRSKS